MFDAEVLFFAYGSDDVESHRSIDAEVLDVSIGCYHDVAYLLPVHSFVRLLVIGVPAGLYFYHHQLAVLGCHDVQFQVVLAPVAV